MAQSIVLKRSALSGKVPGTGSLSLGEIAINTFDGRLFFKKSGSAESVEHIVTTNSTTTGSITLTKTGSFGEIVVTQDGNFQRDIFVTRDIVANGDIDVLGSLTASLSNGYIWVGNGSNKTTLSSTSSFITNLSPLNSYTASIDAKFATLATTTASLLVETSNLELFSASTLNRLTNIESFSSSENSKNTTLATYTSSIDTKFTTLQNVTSSILSFTASTNNTFSASALIRLSNLESTTASLNNTEYRIFTGSISASVNIGSTIFTITSGSSTYFAMDSSGQTAIGGAVASGYKLRVYGGIWADSLQQLQTLAGSSGVGSITFYDQGTLAMNLYASHSAESVKGFFTLKSQDLTYTTPTSQILHTDTDFLDHPTMIIRSRNTSASSLYFQNYHYASGALFVTTQPAGGDTSFRFRPGRTTESFLINSGGVVVNGTSVVSGSMRITGDLVVLGSASFQTVSSSIVNIGNNKITLNTFTPTVRFGGISVIDSGSVNETGSLWWDSQRNHWLYEHPSSSAAPYNSAILISGPYNTGSLGSEIGLTSNRLPLAVGEDHISSSQIYVDNSVVSIPSTLQVTASAYFYKTSTDYISLLDEANTITFAPGAPSYLKYGTATILSMKSGGGNSTILHGAGAGILSATQFGVKIQQSVDGAYANSMLYVKGSGSAATSTAVKVENSSGNPSMTIFDNNRIAINKTSANGTLDISGSVIITGSLDINNARLNATSSATSTGTTTVSTNPTSSFNSAFYNYYIASGSNARAGQIMSVWSDSTVRYTDVATTDIGTTAAASFAVAISAGNVNLNFSASGVWTVKTMVNLL
jgi:hypothetical protein